MPGSEYVTMEVVRELLSVQLQSFKSAVELLTGRINDDIKAIRDDVNDLKSGLSFTCKDVEDIQGKLTALESNCQQIESGVKDQRSIVDSLEDQMEYQENQSRRNNVKLIGIPESDGPESWSDSEKIFMDNVKAELHIEEDLQIERAHRVGSKRQESTYVRRDGSVAPSKPRPIVAKLKSYKDRERILSAAKSIRPPDMKFLEDFSQRTLNKRNSLTPKLLEARQKGKLAYFVAGKLIVRNRLPDRNIHPGVANEEEENEVSFTT